MQEETRIAPDGTHITLVHPIDRQHSADRIARELRRLASARIDAEMAAERAARIREAGNGR